jgi:hypothetical protein
MAENTQVMSLRDCFKAIVSNAHEKALNYAVNYAKYGIEMVDRGDELWIRPSDMRVQCLYVLNNITHWRGDLAKRVRTSLKQHVKDMKQ